MNIQTNENQQKDKYCATSTNTKLTLLCMFKCLSEVMNCLLSVYGPKETGRHTRQRKKTSLKIQIAIS